MMLLWLQTIDKQTQTLMHSKEKYTMMFENRGPLLSKSTSLPMLL